MFEINVLVCRVKQPQDCYSSKLRPIFGLRCARREGGFAMVGRLASRAYIFNL